MRATKVSITALCIYIQTRFPKSLSLNSVDDLVGADGLFGVKICEIAYYQQVHITPQSQQPIKAHQKSYFHYSPTGWEYCQVSDHLVKLSC